ncbi:BnaA05g09500D [Brassica napus]|uniref:Protein DETOXIFICATION n=1 Tax=Brassica napus TaxID=3708 RepID=A0A078FY04_BRANA|nr:BnaA05g09500D [Brassica napus]
MKEEIDHVLSWPLIGEKSSGIKEEVKKQLWLAGPLIAVSLLQFCLQVISVMFVGHLGSLPLSAAAVATSFASVTGFTFLMGTASALDTVCGQSYGAKLYGMLGIQMQRAMLVLTLYSIPLSIIWANTEHFLLFFGQDKSIAHLSGSYAKFMIPSIFAYGLLQCLNRFLQAQNNVFPVVLCSGVTTCLHVILCWVLVLKSGLGFRGAAVANAISYWLNVILLSFYVKYSPSCSLTWTGFSKEALRDIIPFMKLAIPSALMVCLEMWSFEFMVLSSGLLPNPVLETSVLSICLHLFSMCRNINSISNFQRQIIIIILNTSGTIWMIPFGLSGAASTRVSNELGGGNPKVAKLAVRVVISIAILESILVGSVLILIRKIWGFAYSSDPEVVNFVASMLPILALGHCLDSFQSVLSGIARGCGWQKIGAVVNLGSYYLVGIPVGLLLGFHFHLGGRGLWLGIICALIVQGVCLSIITFLTNWDEEVKKATSRVESSSSGVKDFTAENGSILVF